MLFERTLRAQSSKAILARSVYAHIHACICICVYIYIYIIRIGSQCQGYAGPPQVCTHRCAHNNQSEQSTWLETPCLDALNCQYWQKDNVRLCAYSSAAPGAISGCVEASMAQQYFGADWLTARLLSFPCQLAQLGTDCKCRSEAAPGSQSRQRSPAWSHQPRRTRFRKRLSDGIDHEGMLKCPLWKRTTIAGTDHNVTAVRSTRRERGSTSQLIKSKMLCGQRHNGINPIWEMFCWSIPGENQTPFRMGSIPSEKPTLEIQPHWSIEQGIVVAGVVKQWINKGSLNNGDLDCHAPFRGDAFEPCWSLQPLPLGHSNHYISDSSNSSNSTHTTTTTIIIIIIMMIIIT